MADDYYSTLGVTKSATSEEVQKAYRKLARKYHPDLHADSSESEQETAKQKFQQVQQAYDILSDPKKRQMYDQLGPGYDQMGGNPFGGQNPFGQRQNPFGGMDIDLGQIFGNGGGGGGGFEQIFRQMGGGPGQARTRAPEKPKPIEQEITVPFATSVKGGEHRVTFQRQSGNTETITVKIPAGIENGKKIRLRGQGAEGHTGRGDLMIIVKVAPHPNYRRKGLNLMVSVPITLGEAVLGAKVELPTPHGTVTLTVPPGTSSGKSLRLKGMGIHAGDKKGDLIAELQMVLPADLSAEDRKLVQQLEMAYQDKDPRNEIRW